MDRVRFGVYEFDLTTQELRREGTPVHLQAQPSQVLTCLLQRPGETVTRDELRTAVWRGETFVDFERGLNFCISQVRSALRDDAATPLYIQTVPKQGYRFIAPVVRAEAASHLELEAPGHATIPWKRRAWIISICLFGAATVGLLWWIQHRDASGWQKQPALAVARFDNESEDPALTRFSDALTDNVVEQLTLRSQSSLGIIGNASILRRARGQRDLREIGATLHARYVVLGQVQRQGTRIRILAHLIRLPEQTHLWVVRIDGDAVDPMSLEAEAAQNIATQFSTKLAADAKSPLPALGSN